jgi:hypothetical protein
MTTVPKSWVELLNPYLPPAQQNNDSVAYWLAWIHLYALAWGRMLCVQYAIPEARTAWVLGTQVWGPPTPSGYWVLKQALRTILRDILLRDKGPFCWPESKMHQILCGIAPSTNRPYHEFALLQSVNMQSVLTFQIPNGIDGTDPRMLAQVISHDVFGEKKSDLDTTVLGNPGIAVGPLDVPVTLQLYREVLGISYTTIHGNVQLSPELREIWNLGASHRDAINSRIVTALESLDGLPDEPQKAISIVVEGTRYRAMLHRHTPPRDRSWNRPASWAFDERITHRGIRGAELDTSVHD